jgi:hypothetical protein
MRPNQVRRRVVGQEEGPLYRNHTRLLRDSRAHWGRGVGEVYRVHDVKLKRAVVSSQPSKSRLVS